MMLDWREAGIAAGYSLFLLAVAAIAAAAFFL